MELEELGWGASLEPSMEPFRDRGLIPGRVVREDRNTCLVSCAEGEVTAEVAGRLRHQAEERSDLPIVGDWVALDARPGEGRGTIHAVLPRSSRFARNAAGRRTEVQVLAANIDTVFLVTGLDGNFNLRRIERYLTLGWSSGASPVVLLNKTDLCPNVEDRVAEVESIAIGVPVHAVSAAENEGLEALRRYIGRGRTVALLGSSGVGKSSIANRLLGYERQKVVAVREGDSRGRHTTVSRELIVLPGGGVLIDTPGMRELQLWSETEGGENETFSDIEALQGRCRFGDCGHKTEPGCAIRDAVEEGSLDAGRLRSYLKLQRELRRVERRHAHRLRRAASRRAKGARAGRRYRSGYTEED
jgi:ribosome biogenesis GTPase